MRGGSGWQGGILKEMVRETVGRFGGVGNIGEEAADSRIMERETGIEPATSSLGSWRSTAELLPLRTARRLRRLYAGAAMSSSRRRSGCTSISGRALPSRVFARDRGRGVRGSIGVVCGGADASSAPSRAAASVTVSIETDLPFGPSYFRPKASLSRAVG